MAEKNTGKRGMERFSIGLPSVISVDGKEEVIELQTDNICAGGAYFRTGAPLSVGTSLKLKLMLEGSGHAKTGDVLVRILGTVIRTDSKGMAVAFGKNYQMFKACEQKRVAVHVIGPNKLQNELIMQFLEMSAGFKCLRNQKPDLFSIAKEDSDTRHLLLWDCLSKNVFQSIDIVKKNSVMSRCFPAIFNSSPDRICEKESLKRGIRGIFYTTDSPDILIRGIRVILNRKLWYPHETLSEFFADSGKANHVSEAEAGLTVREREILTLLASGDSNQEIADALFISINTVKAHIYRIYKKISVPNRLQAMLWAIRHFSNMNPDCSFSDP